MDSGGWRTTVHGVIKLGTSDPARVHVLYQQLRPRTSLNVCTQPAPARTQPGCQWLLSWSQNREWEGAPNPRRPDSAQLQGYSYRCTVSFKPRLPPEIMCDCGLAKIHIREAAPCISSGTLSSVFLTEIVKASGI